jgi:predicted ATP-binding protein involved in virulence
MKLVRFIGSGIHGYLNLDIKFNSQLTFVTGINGSGKTSALNAIVALISPDLRILATLGYKEISVQLEDADRVHTVTAVVDDNTITLSLSMTPEPFSFKKYVPDSDLPTSRQLDAETQHYKDLLSTNATHHVLRTISTLPTPMFLG